MICVLFIFNIIHFNFIDLAEISEEVLESLKWLRDNLQPWALVLSHWKVTAKYREEKGKLQSFQKVADIFTEWKVLENPKGYELIDIDFKLRNCFRITRVWR